MSQKTVAEESEHNKTRKLLCLVFHRPDWVLLNHILAESQKTFPDMTMDTLCSGLMAQIFKSLKHNPSVEDSPLGLSAPELS